MHLGISLNVAQIQKLVMTPELKQSIQILQFNYQELNQFINEEIMTNPVIDVPNLQGNVQEKVAELGKQKEEKQEKNDIDWKEYFKEYDDISYKSTYNKSKDEEVSFEQFVSSETSLTDHLLFQLQFSMLNEDEMEIGRYLIESLNNNGYLNTTIEEISKSILKDEEIIENILCLIQTFDSVGVGARSLKECLLIQVQQMGIEDDNIKKVIEDHLNDIADNKLANIGKNLNIDIKKIQQISDFIKTLEPKPGRLFASKKDIKYITPDVTVEKIDDEYVVLVNDSTAPRLSVSPYYKRILLNEEKSSNTSKFLNEKLNSAMWLIKSIEQRRQTIFNVVNAIIEYQKEFFDYGRKYLKPLTLKQIANEVGVHESTVSRAVNGKYMQTPRGVFEIKFFFSSGVSNQMGEGVSSQSIKTIIKDLIDNENQKKPLSDQAISDVLKKKGINISRRTVAKYRDEMNIQSSSKRKRF
ncbi:RNA polymerase factor sigma-54 [Anaeromicrobium sediminis]|uniref:RNA polymerase sigma-54 factor n=1 Tax=Anaeromicrobium sediminis TaxID=1478221 RepID=A0A267MMH0_9FIRM|nr:RNA polymerase factor sigma-54 [Anaeromicrobium sediminis]PAB60801.1 RNA polymerase sigma-54 factor [Anaeromicrobium sediminis]